MNQKWTKNGLKIDLKWIWIRNETVLDLEMYQKYTRNAPEYRSEMDLNVTKNGPEMYQKWNWKCNGTIPVVQVVWIIQFSLRLLIVSSFGKNALFHREKLA